MYTVYILYSHKDNKLYVGCTNNLEQRLQSHNNGTVPATKGRRPLVCIHTEEFISIAEAFNRERYLKTLWSARFKNKIKEEYFKRLGKSK